MKCDGDRNAQEIRQQYKKEKYAQHYVIKPPELKSNKFLKSQWNAKKPKWLFFRAG
jgi:hypothetical protein